MKRLMFIAPAVALAAACSGQSGGTIQPGQWETTTRFTSVEMPGVPEAMAKQMQSQLANQAQTQTSCITPAQAANPTGGVLGQNPEGCQFEEQTFSGGVIRVRGTCQSPDGQGQVRMSWEGTYTDTTMQGNLSTELTGGPQNMRMQGTITSRRTGDCPSG